MKHPLAVNILVTKIIGDFTGIIFALIKNSVLNVNNRQAKFVDSPPPPPHAHEGKRREIPARKIEVVILYLNYVK